jgi:hypothetical protein
MDQVSAAAVPDEEAGIRPRLSERTAGRYTPHR